MEAASDAAMGQQSQGERAPELPRELGSGCIKRPEWYKPQLINVAECITKPVTKRIGNFNEPYKKILIDQKVVSHPTPSAFGRIFEDEIVCTIGVCRVCRYTCRRTFTNS